MKSAFLSRATRFDHTTPSLQAMKMKMYVKKGGTEVGQLLRTGDGNSKNYIRLLKVKIIKHFVSPSF